MFNKIPALILTMLFISVVGLKLGATEIEHEKSRRERISESVKFAFGNLAYMDIRIRGAQMGGEARFYFEAYNPPEYGGHIESELLWPLDNLWTGAEVTIGVKAAPYLDMARLSFVWLTKLDRSAGKMEDSDWIEKDVEYINTIYDLADDDSLNGSAVPPFTPWYHPGKDIYSTSDARLDYGSFLDISYTYNVVTCDIMGLGVVGGWRRFTFKLSSWNLDQVGYGPYGPGYMDFCYKDTLNWKWIVYEIEHRIPYLGVSADWAFSRVRLGLQFKYSDWVEIRDKDTHLYPDEDASMGYNHDMVSKGKCTGRSWMANLNLGCNPLPNWWLWVYGEYAGVEAEGTIFQEHYVDGELVAKTDECKHRVNSYVWHVGVTLSCRF